MTMHMNEKKVCKHIAVLLKICFLMNIV